MDNYSPIPVETEEEYKLVISRFPFHDAEIEKVRNINTIYFYNIFNVSIKSPLVKPAYRNSFSRKPQREKSMVIV